MEGPDAINAGTQDCHISLPTHRQVSCSARLPMGVNSPRTRWMNRTGRSLNTKHEKHVVARAIACSMLLLVLPSCGIPKLRQAMPGPDLPASYAASFNGPPSLENSSQVPIEDFFSDPKLVSLICQALAGGNLELRILNEDVQIARNEVLGRSGAYLPFVDLGFVAGLEKFSRFTPLGAAERELTYLPGRNFPDPQGNFIASTYFSWQV